MAPNFKPFRVMMLALLFAFFFFGSTTSFGLAGDYQIIKNLSDPWIQEIAKFAVDQYNLKANKALILEKVVSGAFQVASGLDYKLLIVAKDTAGVVHQCEAVVWDQAWLKYKKLTSFTVLK